MGGADETRDEPGGAARGGAATSVRRGTLSWVSVGTYVILRVTSYWNTIGEEGQLTGAWYETTKAVNIHMAYMDPK